MTTKEIIELLKEKETDFLKTHSFSKFPGIYAFFYIGNDFPLLGDIAAIVFCSCASIQGQDRTAPTNTRHILIVNKTHETIKEINVGDEIRLKLTNSTRVRGHITSIDSIFLTVDSTVVHLNEIQKISTKKGREKKLRAGGLLIAGGIAILIASSSAGSLDTAGQLILLSLGLTGAGVAIMLPGYHKLGKSKFLLILNKPIDR